MDLFPDFKGTRVILASQSPRRKELLGLICKGFVICPPDIDETVPAGLSAAEAAVYTAKRKAEEVFRLTRGEPAIIIACDTVVSIDGEILGKPAGRADGFRMLKKLSGRTHEVISGVALIFGERSASFTQTTRVTFYEMSDGEINAYLDSGEPFDKAGAYGIQGLGGVFAERIDGDFFNVVGLPVARLKRELEALMDIS